MHRLITADRELLMFSDPIQLGPSFVQARLENGQTILFNFHQVSLVGAGAKGLFVTEGTTKEESKKLSTLLRDRTAMFIYTPKGLREAFPDVFRFECEPAYDNEDIDYQDPIIDGLDDPEVDFDDNDYRNMVVVTEVRPNRFCVVTLDEDVPEDDDEPEDPESEEVDSKAQVSDDEDDQDIIHFDYVSAIILPKTRVISKPSKIQTPDPFAKEDGKEVPVSA